MLAATASSDLENLRADLEGSLGKAAVLVQAEDKAGFLADWSGDWTGNALAVARPGSVAQVQACVETRDWSVVGSHPPRAGTW